MISPAALLSSVHAKERQHQPDHQTSTVFGFELHSQELVRSLRIANLSGVSL